MEPFDNYIPADWKGRSESILITDAQGRILWFNPSFYQLCGYELSEVKGAKPGSFLQKSATDQKAVQELREALRAERRCSAKLLNYHKNGRPYWVQIEITPVRNNKGVVTWFAAVEHEISSPDEALALEPALDAFHEVLRNILKQIGDGENPDE